LTHTDAGTSPLRDEVIPTSHGPVTIRQGAYVGACVTILQGVEIGEQSILAAGAVVTKSVPSGVLVGGVPAKVLKTIRADENGTEPSVLLHSNAAGETEMHPDRAIGPKAVEPQPHKTTDHTDYTDKKSARARSEWEAS
jgi:tetrahydrodipicolinate N-succinyltransferase